MPRHIPCCAFPPTTKQQIFLQSRELEVFFGGAAGGGKSIALLMGALQHVAVPGYSALIIRKDLPRLWLPGGLIPRSHEWLSGKAEWNSVRRQWRFATTGQDATLTFGFLARPLDKYRYASSEFQYIAFDELTDFDEDDYLFLFSRLRKPKHLGVPLRIRSASNPGGVGHVWVKQRFVGDSLDAADSAGGLIRRQDRLFIPARIADNPALDENEYRAALGHLPSVARERLMNGDWNIQEAGLIRSEWLRYYVEVAGQLELLEPGGRLLAAIPDGACRRFATIDPAGTSADRTRQAHGRGASWSVAQVWEQPGRELAHLLILRHQERRQVGFGELCALIQRVHREWSPGRLYIEGEKLGQAVVDQLGRELPIFCLPIGVKDKVTRAGTLLLKLERGEVFLPRLENNWRPILEAEWLAWTGDERQPADQIDAAAYAAIVANQNCASPIRVERPIARARK